MSWLSTTLCTTECHCPCERFSVQVANCRQEKHHCHHHQHHFHHRYSSMSAIYWQHCQTSSAPSFPYICFNGKFYEWISWSRHRFNTIWWEAHLHSLMLNDICNMLWDLLNYHSIQFTIRVHGGAVRHCATSRKVAGSIPDGVTGIFHWHSPSGHTMALGLTQPLTEMSIRNISLRVKAVGA